MSCYRPIWAYRRRTTGEFKVGLDKRGGDSDHLELPCGRCIGCKLDRARAWKIRISHEARLFSSNLFLTLTYRDKDLPPLQSLEYGDFQSFMKRLRKRMTGADVGPDGGRPIRFFCAGEYGGETGRPHFHAIMFNLAVPDLRPLTRDLMTSEVLDRLWSKGNVVIGSVNSRTAAYVAGYNLEKIHGVDAAERYEVVDTRTGEVLGCRRRELVVMSRRPGIGAWFFQRYGADMFPGDFVVQDAKQYKVPRYYWEKFKASADPGVVESILYGRFLKAAENLEESSPERRGVKEELAWRRKKHYSQRKL